MENSHIEPVELVDVNLNDTNDHDDHFALLEEESPTKQQDPYRWVQFTLFGIVNIMTILIGIQMQPVARQIIDNYNVSTLTMNCLYMSYFVLFCVFSLPSNYILKEYGSRTSVLIGVFMMTLGAVVKCAINYSFGYCILGAIIAGCGLPFVWNAPAQIAVEWFGESERTGAIAFFIICQYIGGASGYLLNTGFISTNGTKAEFKEGIFNMVTFSAIVCLSLLLLTCVLFRAKPGEVERVPQWNVLLQEDLNQQQTEEDQDLGVKDTFKKLFKNTNLLILSTISGIIQGIFNTFGTCAGELLSVAGYNIKVVSYCGALYIGGGVIGAAIYGYILTKTQAYKKAMISQCVFSFIIIVGFLSLFSFKSGIIASVLCFLMGMASIPSIVIAVDLGAEITFPTNESFSTGIIMIFGQFFSVIFIIFSSMILDRGAGIFECELIFITLGLSALIALYLCKPLKEELLRTVFEQKVKQKQIDEELTIFSQLENSQESTAEEEAKI